MTKSEFKAIQKRILQLAKDVKMLEREFDKHTNNTDRVYYNEKLSEKEVDAKIAVLDKNSKLARKLVIMIQDKIADPVIDMF